MFVLKLMFKINCLRHVQCTFHYNRILSFKSVQFKSYVHKVMLRTYMTHEATKINLATCTYIY